LCRDGVAWKSFMMERIRERIISGNYADTLHTRERLIKRVLKIEEYLNDKLYIAKLCLDKKV